MRHRTSIRQLFLAASAVALSTGAVQAGVTWLQKLVASDAQQGDQFGRSVALQGSAMAISAPLDDDGALQAGSIHVFAQDGAGWAPVAKLLAEDPMDHQLLGYSGLALDAGRLLAGAPGDGAIALQAGAVYLFEDAGPGWVQRAKLAASDAQAFAAFGWAVALDGSTAVVSAYLDDASGSDAGAVYVFEQEAAGWVERTKLTASDAFASDLFGYRLDLEGDRLVVGAPWDDDRGSRSGSVYVFQRAAGIWSQAAKLVPGDLRAGDQFGFDVSLDGPRLAVGAAFADHPAQDGGAAYLMKFAGGVWSVETRLTASVPEPFDGFGSRVALDDNALLVTSALDDNEWGVDAGSATVFLRVDGTWRPEVTLSAYDGEAADLFAADAALDGGLALIGAARDDEPMDDEGSAYLYRAAAPIGIPYCVAAPNSAGPGASLRALGSRQVARADLTFEAQGLPPGVPGILFFGPGQVQSPFGDGTRCVGGGPHYRVWPFVHADPSGHARHALAWDAGYADFIAAGLSLNFQLWYRDIAAGGSGFNLTDALEIAFE